MSEWDSINFAPQGWQCPICKRVYSPTTFMCYYCGNGVPYTFSSTTVGDAINAYKTKEEIDRQIKGRRMTDTVIEIEEDE